jgi:hypothetical protein
MPIQFTEEKGGKLLVIHLSGKLETADYELVVPEIRTTHPAARKIEHPVRDG